MIVRNGGISMEVGNLRYSNQGIHVISSIFTVEKGITKVLLIKRSNEPYKDMWALVGGALYNNEDLIDGAKREIWEKTGLKDIDIYLADVFGKVDRSPVMRMVAISFVGVVDSKRVEILKETFNTSNADWFPIDKIPKLAFDHVEILNNGLNVLKEKIVESDILKSLYPDGFTIPEIQKVYETVLNKKFDRRNFRKKLLSLELIEDTNKTKIFMGSKPAKIYRFKKRKFKNKNIL